MSDDAGGGDARLEYLAKCTESGRLDRARKLVSKVEFLIADSELAIAAVALAADGPVTIENAEAMAVSYPGFATQLDSVVRR